MSTATQTAYSYVRFSSSPQEKGDSVRRQTELSNAYAEKHNLVIDTTLNLHDLGVSAYKGLNATKGALGVFLRAIKDKRVNSGSFLLVESFDRLSRETPLDALDQFKEIIESGVTIVTLSDDKTYSKESIKKDSMKLMYTVMVMARAHEESEIKSHRLKAAWATKRKNTGAGNKNLTAKCPSWLTAKPDNRGFDLIPENVAVVREILGLTSMGMGQSQIVKIFNKRKQKPFGHGKGWHSSSIQKILTSPALYGDFHLGKYENGKKVLTGEIISDYFPALITKEEFYLIQSGRKLRMEPGGRAKKGTTVSNLFSGLLKCGYCGGGMTLIGSSAKRQKNDAGEALVRLGRKAIACDNGRRGVRCWAVQWAYKDFETTFLTFCNELNLNDFLISREKDASNRGELEQLLAESRSLVGQIQQLEANADNIVAAIETGKDSTRLPARLEQIEIDIDVLKKRKDKVDNDASTYQSRKKQQSEQAQLLKNALNEIEGLDGEQLFEFRCALKEHIRLLIKEVLVYPAGTITTREEADKIKVGLLQFGMSESEIDEYFSKTVRLAPVKQGKGKRGRYENRKDLGRFLTISTTSDNFILVQPDFGQPNKIELKIDVKEKSWTDWRDVWQKENL